VDDVYYTWRSDYNGYIATDPPPAAERTPADAGDSGTQSGGTSDVYIYPRNGQSDEQTSTDRYECHKWAKAQTGFDPTQSQSSGSAADYRRAMLACLDARGYSAK
jgi:hypothetical protein